MAILVVGGKGFIGSQVIPKLLALGEQIVCLEPRDTPGRLGHHAGQIAMETGSVANMDDVLAVFDKHHITKIASLAFFAFRDNPERLHSEMSIMIQGTANMFEAARLQQFPLTTYNSYTTYVGSLSRAI